MFINIHGKMKVAMMLIKTKKSKTKTTKAIVEKKTMTMKRKQASKENAKLTNKQTSAALFSFDWVI